MPLANLRRTHVAGAAALLGLGAILLFWAPWSARAESALRTSNVAVSCDPRQQAVVRQTIVNGELQVDIQCVSGGSMQQPIVYADQYGRPLQAVPMAGVGAVPAVYSPQPGYGAQPIYAPRPVVQQASSTRRVASARTGNRRSWQKTGLVIGGSAGAGAGIGALIGGKKGALIGAAIGGGSATLYEAVKR